jgi:hypothetical protein
VELALEHSKRHQPIDVAVMQLLLRRHQAPKVTRSQRKHWLEKELQLLTDDSSKLCT